MIDDAEGFLADSEEWDLTVFSHGSALKESALAKAIEATLAPLFASATVTDRQLRWRRRQKGFVFTVHVVKRQERPETAVDAFKALRAVPELCVQTSEPAKPAPKPRLRPVTCECRDCRHQTTASVSSVLAKNPRCPACGGGMDVIPEHQGRLV